MHLEKAVDAVELVDDVGQIQGGFDFITLDKRFGGALGIILRFLLEVLEDIFRCTSVIYIGLHYLLEYSKEGSLRVYL